MKKHILGSICLGVLLISAAMSTQAQVIANYTLSNPEGYSGDPATNFAGGLGLDSVGDNDFTVRPGLTFGGSLGGASSTSTYFSGTDYVYLYCDSPITGSLSTLVDNFAINVYVNTTSLSTRGALLTTNGNNAGSLQIGTDGSGNWFAVLNSGGTPLSGTTIGSAAISSGTNTLLTLQSVNGVFSFAVNGVSAGTITPTTAFSGFNSGGGYFIGTSAGGTVSYAGYASDLTIAAIPEPGTTGMVIGGLGLMALLLRRQRKIA